jgi:hypothetical protein
MKKYLQFYASVAAIFFFLLSTNDVFAQRGEVIAGGNLSIGLPQGPFQDQLDEIGFGLNGIVGYALPGAPLMIGLDLGYHIFGMERRTEPLSTTIPDLRVDVENSYNMFTTLLLVRTTGRARVFRPYVDAMVGFNYLFTQTTVRSRSTQEEFASDTNFDDFAFTYGGGAGMQYRVYRQRGTNVYLNIQSKYIIGGKADYLKPGSIQRENGQVKYDVSTSRTDMLYFQIGVVAAF